MIACDGTSRGMGNYVPWTPEGKATLRRLHAEGLTRDQIALAMGIAFGRVRDMMFRMGLRQQRMNLPPVVVQKRAQVKRERNQKGYNARHGPAIDPGDRFTDDLDATEQMWRRAQPRFEDGPTEPYDGAYNPMPVDAREITR